MSWEHQVIYARRIDGDVYECTYPDDVSCSRLSWGSFEKIARKPITRTLKVYVDDDIIEKKHSVCQWQDGEFVGEQRR